jgi:thiosulfate/3-mercaptopyruvate sulfurtransferase
MTKALLSPAELAALMDSEPVVLIDTRSPKRYAEGHIQGAINIHDVFTYLARSSPEGLAELRDKFTAAFGAAGLSGQETAVIYEDSMDSGFGQSCRGYFLLKYLGYPKAAVLHGGLEEWLEDGRPVTIEASVAAPAVFPFDASGASIMVDKDHVLEVVRNGGATLLDVRDVDEWIAESSSPYGKDFCPRKGRIPGAKWIEWRRMMKPTPTSPKVKSRTEILAECATVGLTPETPVILYCFKGARAANTFLALKEAGVSDVRMYFGSWNEWSRDPALPIESGLPYAE